MSCIVVFRQPDRIILAVDSLATSAEQHGTSLYTHRSDGAKMRTYGRWSLALCGFSKGPNGLDVRETIGREVGATMTMAEALQAVQRVFERRLLPSLNLARHYPAFHDLFDAVGGSVLALFVAGVEPPSLRSGGDADGTLALGAFGADVVAMDPLQCRMYGGALPGILGDGSRPFYHAVGQELAVSLVNAESRPDWLARGDAEAARRVLEMQIEATPDRVAAPFQIVEITKRGTTECSVGAQEERVC